MNSIISNIIQKKWLFILICLAFQGYSQNTNTNYLLILKALNRAKQAQSAITYFTDSINSNPKDANLLIEVGNSFYQLADYENAANYYIQAFKTNNKIGGFELAKCFAHLNKQEQAIHYLSTYLSLNNKLPLSIVKADKAFTNLSNTNAWNELWQNDWYSQNELLYNDADYEFRIGNYDESIKIIESLLKIRPSYHQASNLLALNYEQNKQYKWALLELDKALDLKPENATYLFNKSRILLKLEKDKKALATINQAIQIDSSEIEYFILRTKVNLALKQNEWAEADIQKIINYYKSAETYQIAGKTYYECNNYLSALKYYNKSLAIQSLNPDLYIERADVYNKSGAYEFAEKDYTMALDFYPYNGEIYYKRALVRINQKNYSEACSDLNKARNYGFVKAEEMINRYCQSNY